MPWNSVALSNKQLVDGELDRIQRSMTQALLKAGAPPYAAVFIRSAAGSTAIYISPAAVEIAKKVGLNAKLCPPPAPPVVWLTGDFKAYRLLLH